MKKRKPPTLMDVAALVFEAREYAELVALGRAYPDNAAKLMRELADMLEKVAGLTLPPSRRKR